MPSLKHPKGSGHAAKHDRDVLASDLILRGRDTAAAHAKRPSRTSHDRLRATLHASGSGATARRPDHAEGE
jgi:hypothetical protein